MAQRTIERVSRCSHATWAVRSGTAGGDYRRCETCGLEEQASLHDVSTRFTDAQDEWYGADDPACLTPFALALSARDAEYRMRILRRVAPVGRMLEVGPGSGQFAAAAIASGYQVFAIEDSAVLAAAAAERGVPVHQGTFESAPVEPGSIDTVVSWHVIEHVEDPVTFLRRALEVTKPNGLLVIGTPNAASYEHRMSGRLSPNYSRPHLRLFTPSSLEDVVREAGWEPIDSFTTDEPEHWLKVGAGLARAVLSRRQPSAAATEAGTGTDQPLAVQRIGAARGTAVVQVAGAVSWLPRRVQVRVGRGNELITLGRRPG